MLTSYISAPTTPNCTSVGQFFRDPWDPCRFYVCTAAAEPWIQNGVVRNLVPASSACANGASVSTAFQDGSMYNPCTVMNAACLATPSPTMAPPPPPPTPQPTPAPVPGQLACEKTPQLGCSRCRGVQCAQLEPKPFRTQSPWFNPRTKNFDLIFVCETQPVKRKVLVQIERSVLAGMALWTWCGVNEKLPVSECALWACESQSRERKGISVNLLRIHSCQVLCQSF